MIFFYTPMIAGEPIFETHSSQTCLCEIKRKPALQTQVCSAGIYQAKYQRLLNFKCLVLTLPNIW